jgi:hypothetical protein
MSDTLSFTELEGQHVELLPAGTVLSLFSFTVSAKPCDKYFNCNFGSGTQTNTTGAGR